MSDVKKAKAAIMKLISVSDGTPPEAEGRLKEAGWMVYVHVGVESDALRSTNAIGKGYPRLVIHNIARFDNDGSIWQTDEFGEMHLALGAVRPEDDLSDISEELIDAFRSYYRSSKPVEEKKRPKEILDVTEAKDDPKNCDIKPERSGRAGAFEYGKRQKFGPKNLGNTWGHVKASREEWFFALNYTGETTEKTEEVRKAYQGEILRVQEKLLDKPFDKKWDIHDLIRHLRVRAGRTTVDAENILGIDQGAYSGFETAGQPRISTLLRLINAQFFRLPEIDGAVDVYYANKLLEKAGYKDFNFIPQTDEVRERFFLILLRSVDEYKKGRTIDRYSEVPTLNDCLSYVLNDYGYAGNERIKMLINAIRGKKYSSLKDFFDNEVAGHNLTNGQIEILQDLPIIYEVGDSPIPQPFNKDLWFLVAKKEAKNAGEFLDMYRRFNDNSMKKVAKGLGLSRTRVQQLKHQLYLGNLDRIIEHPDNPYGLTTGKDGEVCTDIVEHLREINVKPVRKPYPLNRKRSDSGTLPPSRPR